VNAETVYLALRVARPDVRRLGDRTLRAFDLSLFYDGNHKAMTDPTDAPTTHEPHVETAPAEPLAANVANAHEHEHQEQPDCDANAPTVPIAPDVPRLGRPSGTAASIPASILGPSPSWGLFTIIALITLVADVGSKVWAEKRLEGYPGYLTLVEDRLMFVLARNKGGAWGLLQGQPENIRVPFFLLVGFGASVFIVTLYRRLLPSQRALRWGLPLVLGGALGNVVDRVRYGFVIDFIDYRAHWIQIFNEWIHKRFPAHVVTDHWPTFNVADVAICVGIGLLAIDTFTARRGPEGVPSPDVPIEPLEPVDSAEPGHALAPGEPGANEITNLSHDSAVLADEAPHSAKPGASGSSESS